MLNSDDGGVTALRLVLRTARLSQAELARSFGVLRQWVSDVLNGQVLLSMNFVRDVLINLAEYLTADLAKLRAIFLPDPAGGQKTWALEWHPAKTGGA